MSRASLVSLAVFLSFAAGGLVLWMSVRTTALGVAAFVALSLAGSAAAGLLFDRLASPAEKQREMEDRVRHNDG